MIVLLAQLAGCGRHEIPTVSQAKCNTEQDCLKALQKESQKQAATLTQQCCQAESPNRRVIIVGNGIAATLPRHPNAIWSQLDDDRLPPGLIADGHNLDANTF